MQNRGFDGDRTGDGEGRSARGTTAARLLREPEMETADRAFGFSRGDAAVTGFGRSGEEKRRRRWPVGDGRWLAANGRRRGMEVGGCCERMGVGRGAGGKKKRERETEEEKSRGGGCWAAADA